MTHNSFFHPFARQYVVLAPSCYGPLGISWVIWWHSSHRCLSELLIPTCLRIILKEWGGFYLYFIFDRHICFNLLAFLLLTILEKRRKKGAHKIKTTRTKTTLHNHTRTSRHRLMLNRKVLLKIGKSEGTWLGGFSIYLRLVYFN